MKYSIKNIQNSKKIQKNLLSQFSSTIFKINASLTLYEYADILKTKTI